MPQDMVGLLYLSKSTFFRHFLAHSPNILANVLRNLTREEKWETARAFFAMLRHIMREADSLNAQGLVADYLENRVFLPINDTI
ncbi:hypothetical protein [Ktedonobacter racemifer]|uniref:Uncharacterized protein n=1 Tax=Ktedonobacter racemifer DSM 44963 TaxID=485913 RepID=D6TM47_KTERA|nr:hypothetical protein [Ktedonobacter racemifer]EFH86847.1 hypothetical protein Krac_8163 [Ktedonobacter racemifer DSM 44963]